MFQRKPMPVMSATQVAAGPKSIARFTVLLRCLVLALAGLEGRLPRTARAGTVPIRQSGR